MNNKLISAVVVATVLGSTTFAVADDGGNGHRKGPMLSIEEMDTNGDQMISKEEIAAHAKSRFDTVDTNGDGKLSTEEMAANAKKEITKRMEKRHAKILKRLDEDGDGLLSFEEMQAKRQERGNKMFDRLDENEDGMLSAEELEKMKQKGKRHGKKNKHEDNDSN